MRRVTKRKGTKRAVLNVALTDRGIEGITSL
jgi:hypothetical protein